MTRPDPELIRSNLGSTWEMLDLYFKPYAACRWGQPAVAGALKVSGNNGADAGSDPAHPGAHFRGGHPPAQRPSPKHGRGPVQPGLSGSRGPAGRRSGAGARCCRRACTIPNCWTCWTRCPPKRHPNSRPNFPPRHRAEVVVETIDGQTYRSGRIEALWEPPDTLPSDQELEAKFLWLTGPVLGTLRSQAEFAEQIWSADRWATIDPIDRRMPDAITAGTVAKKTGRQCRQANGRNRP
jgi:hypothetical protein